MPARDFRIRVSFFYAFLFLGLGVQMPFLPLWLAGQGFGTTDIAIILAAQIAVRAIASPAGTYLADRGGRPVLLIRIFGALCCLSYLVLGAMTQFWSVLAVAVIAGAFYSPIPALAEAHAMDGSVRHGLEYGRLRVWGSLSFAAGTLISGLTLEAIGNFYIIYLLAAGQGLISLAGLVLHDEPHRAGERPRIAQAAGLLRDRMFVIFLASVSLAQASHALIYGFGSLHWQALGHSEAMIGLLWGLGVAGEILLFFYSRKAVSALTPQTIILFGAAGGLLRWAIDALDPPLALLACSQVLHAASFALTHLGTMLYIHQNIPARVRNSAQGLYSAFSGGIVMMIATSAAGPLYAALAAKAYLAMAAMSLGAIAMALMLRRLNPTNPAAPDASGSPRS